MRECEYILEYDGDYPTFEYTLCMHILFNGKCINSHMRGLMEIWFNNMNFQLVIDIDKIIVYMIKYVTKPEIEISFGMKKMIKIL